MNFQLRCVVERAVELDVVELRMVWELGEHFAVSSWMLQG